MNGGCPDFKNTIRRINPRPPGMSVPKWLARTAPMLGVAYARLQYLWNDPRSKLGFDEIENLRALDRQLNDANARLRELRDQLQRLERELSSVKRARNAADFTSAGLAMAGEKA